MQTVVVLAVLVAVAFAQNPPRPNIPETFYSEGQVESHEHDAAFFGDAQWASDVKQQKSIETYDLKSGIRKLFVLTLQRFDLGEVFEIDSSDRNECRERVVNGTMPTFWGWVSQAQYVGKDIFRTLEVDLWDATFAGLTLRVGVAAPNYNVPVFFARVGNGIDFLYEFHRFENASTIDPKYFEIPPQCQGQQQVREMVAAPALEAPARPNIPSTFESDTEIRLDRGDQLNDGEGHWNEDLTAGKAVEEAHLHDSKSHQDFYVLALARFDLGKFYEVNSDNRTGCDVKPLTGKMQSAWAWVANATYTGQRVDHRGTKVDIWNYVVSGGLNLTLGVDSQNANLPIALLRQAPHFEEELFFTRFSGQTPPSQYFDVPRQCSQTKKATAPKKFTLAL